MAEMKKRIEIIEKLFSNLEKFWSSIAAEAVKHEDWSDFDMLNFTLEIGIPYDQYERLIREVGEDLKSEYADRLARLDALIAQNEPGLKELLKTS